MQAGNGDKLLLAVAFAFLEWAEDMGDLMGVLTSKARISKRTVARHA